MSWEYSRYLNRWYSSRCLHLVFINITAWNTVYNKNAYQYDAYRPLVDRMLESASRGVSAPGVSVPEGLLPGGGVCLEGVCFRGVSAPGGSAPGGSAPRGGCIPACTETDTPLLTESQTPVKILPWPNFVAAGN